jgi:integrase
LKLTERSIAGLSLPTGKIEDIVFDDAMPGFGIRIRPGSKKYHVQRRAFGRQLKKSLGDVGRMTLDQARTAARQWFAQIALGIDPAAEKAKVRAASAATALTLGVAAGRYLDYKQARLSRSSFNSAKHHYEVHFAALTNRPIADIKRADVATCLQDIVKQNGAGACKRARGQLNSLFVWCISEGLCEANPVVGTNNPLKGIDTSRDRVLSDAELVQVWNACDTDADFGKIIRLLILTGCRRGEIGGLRWSEVDLATGTITISGERTKTGKTHTLVLPEMALDILRTIPRRRDFLFGESGQGFQRWGAYLDAHRDRLPDLPLWTPHDLRRTFRTGLGRIGIRPDVAELCVNHAKRGVIAVYDRGRYEGEITSALAQWAAHVAAIIDGRASNVVPLKRA